MSRMRVMIVACAIAAIGAANASATSGDSGSTKQGCQAAIERQVANGISAGGGFKEGILAPANCDHFFNSLH